MLPQAYLLAAAPPPHTHTQCTHNEQKRTQTTQSQSQLPLWATAPHASRAQVSDAKLDQYNDEKARFSAVPQMRFATVAPPTLTYDQYTKCEYSVGTCRKEGGGPAGEAVQHVFCLPAGPSTWIVSLLVCSREANGGEGSLGSLACCWSY